MFHPRTSSAPAIRVGVVFAFVLSVLTLARAAANGPAVQTIQILKGASNGGQPWVAPISDQAGNFYGTTSEGGVGVCFTSQWKPGCGTVYKLSPPVNGTQWTDTQLYQFHSRADGNYPVGSVVFDQAGNLYGTTEYGGSATYECGTAFELTPLSSGSGAWTKTSIYNFNCDSNGSWPRAGLVIDKLGNLYGTAVAGGSCSASSGGCGVVFELSPPSRAGASWTQSVLYSFQGGTDGAGPQGQLVFDASGSLYGITTSGGSQNCGYDSGCGTIFELSPPSSIGGSWTESVLYAFSSQDEDGYLPTSGMVFAKSGALYGVTEGGGPNSEGTVYQLSPPASPGVGWTESVIFGFGLNDDGVGPFGTPAVGSDGSIYGTTQAGGPTEEGNAFQLTPPASPGGPWTESTLLTFTNHAYPIAGLNMGPDGWLYGATLGAEGTGICATGVKGPQYACGQIFRILPH